MTLAVLVTVPACVTRAVIVNPALPPLAIEPTVQRPVAESYAPCDGAADSNASPADNTSVTATPVAGLGPWLATITLNVSSSPTCGDERVSALVTLRLADSAALSVTLALLLAAFGSTSVCCVMVAVLTRAPGAVTVATIVSVAGVPVSLRVPTVHVGRRVGALRRRRRHERQARGQRIGDDHPGGRARTRCWSPSP